MRFAGNSRKNVLNHTEQEKECDHGLTVSEVVAAWQHLSLALWDSPQRWEFVVREKFVLLPLHVVNLVLRCPFESAGCYQESACTNSKKPLVTLTDKPQRSDQSTASNCAGLRSSGPTKL